MFRERLTLGRNYVETLVLSLMNLEYQSLGSGRESEVAVYVARTLEEAVCSLGYVDEFVRTTYVKSLQRVFKGMFPDIPEPSWDSCYNFEKLVEHLWDYRGRVLGVSPDLLTRSEKTRKIAPLAAKVVRTAVIGTFAKLGLITMGSRG